MWTSMLTNAQTREWTSAWDERLVILMIIISSMIIVIAIVNHQSSSSSSSSFFFFFSGTSFNSNTMQSSLRQFSQQGCYQRLFKASCIFLFNSGQSSLATEPASCGRGNRFSWSCQAISRAFTSVVVNGSPS